MGGTGSGSIFVAGIVPGIEWMEFLEPYKFTFQGAIFLLFSVSFVYIDGFFFATVGADKSQFYFLKHPSRDRR